MLFFSRPLCLSSLRVKPIYGLFIVALLWFISQVIYPASHTLTHGFAAYFSAARLLHSGPLLPQVYNPVYFRPIVQADSRHQADDIYHANPPTTALLLWSLSFLSIDQARLVWTIANVVMLFGGLTLLSLTFSPRFNLSNRSGLSSLTGFQFLAGLFTLGMLFQPVIDNIRSGQAYLLIFFLLTLAVVALSKNQAGLSGLTLALALILKTAGWALLPLLAWQQRWRVLVWTMGGVVVIILLTLPLFPPVTWQSYLQLFHQSVSAPQTCAAAYQTNRSLLCRLLVFEPTWSPWPLVNLPWLADWLLVGLAAATLIVNLWLAHRQPMAAVMATIIWGILFAPLGEQYHHTVMLIPLTWLLFGWLNLPKFGQMMVATAMVLYLLPLHLVNDRGILLAYPRLYGAWLLLVAVYMASRYGGQRSTGRDY